MSDKKYKVLEHEKKSGLTIGNYSRKPGFIFSEKEFLGTDEDFQFALETKRCELIKVEKKVEKKLEKKSEKYKNSDNKNSHNRENK